MWYRIQKIMKYMKTFVFIHITVKCGIINSLSFEERLKNYILFVQEFFVSKLFNVFGVQFCLKENCEI